MTTDEPAEDRPRLHDTVQLVSKTFFDDYRPREGRVVAVTDDTVSAEFPDPHNRPGYPPMTFHMADPEWRQHLLVVRRAEVDELDKVRAQLAEAQNRLSRIGSYAAIAGTAARSGLDSAAFQRIARLARDVDA